MLRARPAATALLVLVGAAAFADARPGTLRLDYFHTGGPGVEVFAVDRVVIEPLPWPGPVASDVDPADLGGYRFVVRDASGRETYSQGFDSVYGEWATTAEATEVHRTFHESLRFPVPAGRVEVIVQRRHGQRQFDTVWSTFVDPSDPYVVRAWPPQHAPVAIEQNGAPPDKVDVLLLGEGYTATECAGRFSADARRMAETLFAREPFASRRTDFNLWGLCPPAPESGVSRPSTGIQRWTPAGATYDAFGSERYVLTFDNRALREIAAWAPYEFIVILVNSETYGGGGIFGAFSTVAVRSEWADYLFVHEFAHHFAALADEYYTSPVAYEPVEAVTEPWEPNVTALLEGEPLKWGDLVSEGTPVPTPWPKEAFEARQREFQQRRQQIRAERRPESEMNALFVEERDYTTRLLAASPVAGRTGAFQGARYDARSYYRSQIDCVMFTRDDVPFCHVCQHAIDRVIDRYAGPRGTP